MDKDQLKDFNIDEIKLKLLSKLWMALIVLACLVIVETVLSAIK